MPTALAISPHLDDAVFSAGGTLAGLARDGWHVVIATVFTASVADPGGFALACQLDKGLAPDIDYMALRREEDRKACAVLGAQPIWLCFREAPHRGYESAPALFAGLHADDPVVAEIAPSLVGVIAEVAPVVVFAPLCVGAHVDHVAVHLAVRSCGVRTRYWTDYPYVARDGARPSPFAAELAAAAVDIAVLPTRDLALKVEAASCYASQLGFQFGGADAARATLAASGAIERFTEPEPRPAGMAWPCE